jgi:hypothetical protein
MTRHYYLPGTLSVVLGFLVGVVAASMIVQDNLLVSLGAGALFGLVLLSLTNRNEF